MSIVSKPLARWHAPKREVQSSRIAALARTFGGHERKYPPPERGGHRITWKHHELPRTRHARENRHGESAACSRAAMRAQHEELTESKVARRGHEGKRAPPYEREPDWDLARKADKGPAKRLLEPIREIVWLPTPGGGQLVCVGVKFGKVVEVEWVSTLQPLTKVIDLSRISQRDRIRGGQTRPASHL
jgi:hypothetical protein